MFAPLRTLPQVWGALYVLRVLTRKYEFKDEDERAPLAPVVNAAFPPLLAMLQVRLRAPSSPNPITCSLFRIASKRWCRLVGLAYES